MKKIKDPSLFHHVKLFLGVYLPSVRSKSDNTIISYRDTLNLYFCFLKESEGIPLEHATAGHFNEKNILSFIAWLKSSRKNNVSSCNLRLSGIRGFCKYLMGENVIPYDSYARICSIEKQKAPERPCMEILGIDEMKKLLELSDHTKKSGLRDWFYIALLYDSGCRNNEILSLRLKDICLTGSDGGNLSVMGKGNRFRVTPLSVEVMEIFKKYAAKFHPENNPDEYLFYTVRQGARTPMSPDNVARFLNKYEKMMRLDLPDIPHLHPHLFRHTRAMHLYQAGMPLAMVSEWLGHSQLETTLIYARADTEMKRRAVEKVSSAENSVFTNESFKYADDEEMIKKLYGLA